MSMSAVRVRACLSFDIDGLALIRAKRALGVDLPDGLADLMQRDQTVYFDRLLGFYDRLGVPQSVFIPTLTARAEPDRVHRLIDSGHEIGFHGWDHLPFASLDAAGERAEFQNSVDVFRAEFGVRLRGMRAPSYGLSDRTPENVIAAGMTYDSSAVAEFLPQRMTRAAGGYWSLPTHAQLDDWAHCVHLPRLGYDRPMLPAAQVLRVYKDTFDRCYAEGGCFVTVWHPFVTLCDRYIGVADALADYIAGHTGVVFSTLADMADALDAQRGPYSPQDGAGISQAARITRA
ncbi:polysaccharide deacetylase family protein [Rhodobacteraceae bacterium F11138]|nr:polysaccharide deacetylase family protein [Rhodobacteraceae bacterium F11138]